MMALVQTLKAAIQKTLKNVSIESRIQDQSKICRQERYYFIHPDTTTPPHKRQERK